jgi:hypothetical protein
MYAITGDCHTSSKTAKWFVLSPKQYLNSLTLLLPAPSLEAFDLRRVLQYNFSFTKMMLRNVTELQTPAHLTDPHTITLLHPCSELFSMDPQINTFGSGYLCLSVIGAALTEPPLMAAQYNKCHHYTPYI